MADFVAVLKKTLDGLGETTPQVREKVYGKARATIDAKLASLNPPPPAAVAERQKRSLEEAISTVEDEYASIAARQPGPPDDLDDVFASMALPGDAGRTSLEKQPQPLADPAFDEDRDPFDGSVEDLSTRAAPLPPRPRRRWAARLAAAVVALAVLAGAAYGIWLNRDEFSAMLGVDVSRLFASKAKPGSDDPVNQTNATAKKPAETKAEARKRREAEKAAAVAKAADVPEAPAAEAPVPAPAPAIAALPGEADPAAAVVPTPVKFTQRLSPDGTEVDAGPAGGAPTVGEGSSTAASTLPAPAATVADVLVAQAEPVAPTDPAVPEAPAEPVPAAPEAAAAVSPEPPADPVIAAADPAPPAEAGAPPAEAAPAEGAPTPEASLAPEVAPLAEAAPAAEGSPAVPAAADASSAAAPVAPATTPDTAVATTAAPAPASVAVGQKAIFYEERTTAESGSAETGGIVWSLVQESPGGDLPPEPAIRAEATIPGKDLQLRMTIKRNGDQTLPASHIVELIFLTPEGFEGGGIDNVLRIALKTSEEEAGAPLLGVPAKIADGFFLFALNDSKPDVDANSALLNGRNWIDVPILYKSGRRALFTMEKGIPGEKVFQDAMKAWAAAGSG